MARNSDIAHLSVFVDGTPVTNTIKSLAKDFRKLKREVESTSQSNADFQEKAKEYGRVRNELVGLRKELKQIAWEVQGIPEDSIEGLTKRASQLEEQMGKLSTSSQEYKQKLLEYDEVKKTLERVKAEAKALTEVVESVPKDSIQGMKNRLEELNEQLIKAKRGGEKFVALSAAFKTLSQEIKETEKEAKKLEEAIESFPKGSLKAAESEVKELREELSRLPEESEEFNSKVQELRNAEKRFDNVKNKVKGVTEAFKTQKGSIKDLEREFNKLNNEIRSINPETQKFNEKLKELAKTEKSLDRARRSMNRFKASQKQSISITQRLGKFMKANWIALVAVIGMAIKKGLEYAWRLSQEMEELRGKINILTGEVGDSLNKVSARVKALSNIFEISIKEILEAGQSLSTAFGKKMYESLDSLAKGLILVGDKAGELLDQIYEYSSRLEEAGFIASQAVALIVNSINMGTFNDSLVDSVKELDLRLEQLSESAKNLLNLKFGKELTEQILANSGDTVKALQLISGGIAELLENGEDVNELVSVLFGEPGENLTAGNIARIKDMNLNLDELVGTGNTYIQLKQRELILEEKAAIASASLSQEIEGLSAWFRRAGKNISRFFVGGLAATLKFFNYLPGRIKIFGSLMSHAAAKFANAWIKVINRIRKSLGFDPVKEFEASGENIRNARKALQEKIAKDKRDYEASQAVENLKNIKQYKAAERLERVKQEVATQKAERKTYKEEADKMSKLRAESQAEIERLQIELMEDGLEKKITLLRFETRKKIEAIKGGQAEIEQLTLLYEKRLAKQIKALRKEEEVENAAARAKDASEAKESRDKEYAQRLESLKRSRDEEALIDTQTAVEKIRNGEDSVVAEEVLNQQLLDGQIDFLEAKKELQQEFGMDSLETQTQIEQMKLDEARRRAEEELEIEREKEEKKEQAKQQALTKTRQLGQAMTAFWKAKLDEELDLLDQQKEAELEKAGDNEAARAEIEAKFQEKKEEAQKKAAKKQKGVSIANTLINTAESIVKTGATLGYPLAIPFQVMAGAIGALQIATIRKQKFADGGFTGEAPWGAVPDETGEIPVGLVHRHEYIVPRRVVEDPASIPLIKSLERMRRGQKFADGGMALDSPTLSHSNIDVNPSDDSLAAVGQKMDKIHHTLQRMRDDIQNQRLVSIIGEKEANVIDKAQKELYRRRGTAL